MPHFAKPNRTEPILVWSSSLPSRVARLLLSAINLNDCHKNVASVDAMAMWPCGHGHHEPLPPAQAFFSVSPAGGSV